MRNQLLFSKQFNLIYSKRCWTVEARILKHRVSTVHTDSSPVSSYHAEYKFTNTVPNSPQHFASIEGGICQLQFALLWHVNYLRYCALYWWRRLRQMSKFALRLGTKRHRQLNIYVERGQTHANIFITIDDPWQCIRCIRIDASNLLTGNDDIIALTLWYQ